MKTSTTTSNVWEKIIHLDFERTQSHSLVSCKRYCISCSSKVVIWSCKFPSLSLYFSYNFDEDLSESRLHFVAVHRCYLFGKKKWDGDYLGLHPSNMNFWLSSFKDSYLKLLNFFEYSSSTLWIGRLIQLGDLSCLLYNKINIHESIRRNRNRWLGNRLKCTHIALTIKSTYVSFLIVVSFVATLFFVLSDRRFVQYSQIGNSTHILLS